MQIFCQIQLNISISGVANINGILKKLEFPVFIASKQKYNQILYIDYAKAFDYMNHNKLWKILKEMGI